MINKSDNLSDFPIFIIGAGGIVNTAHLPAYKIANYTIAGIFDLNIEKATATANEFNIPHVFNSISDLILSAPNNAIFDIAVPASQILQVLNQLPCDSFVLIQKPMGDNFADAQKILQLVKQKNICAAINFQLRYAPYILAAKDFIKNGLLGNLNDIEINVNVFTPWDLWDFLAQSQRVEILYHSIHYIDLIRNLLGNPISLYAKTTKHPSLPSLASVRSNIIMDYGDFVRANILTNHCHNYGQPKQQSYIKIEGDKGAIIINFGALIDYPRGGADSFEYIILKDGEQSQWQKLAIEGSWFPHAFIGSMEQLLLAASGKIQKPDNSVDDCIITMACVEATYQSSLNGGVALIDILS